MPTAFKNAPFDGKAVTANTDMTIYTVPASTTSTAIGLMLANVTTVGGSPVEIGVKVWLDKSGTLYYFADGWPIPAGGSVELIEGKIVLETGDAIKMKSDTANSLDAVLSYLEQT